MRSGLFLLAVPGTCAFLGAVLYLSAVAERRLLSPRRLILGAARARRSTPEFAEEFVARQFERLLREESDRPLAGPPRRGSAVAAAPAGVSVRRPASPADKAGGLPMPDGRPNSAAPGA